MQASPLNCSHVDEWQVRPARPACQIEAFLLMHPAGRRSDKLTMPGCTWLEWSRTSWTHPNPVCLFAVLRVHNGCGHWVSAPGWSLKRVKATQARSVNHRASIISMCHHHQPILECLSMQSYTKWFVAFTVLFVANKSKLTCLEDVDVEIVEISSPMSHAHVLEAAPWHSHVVQRK